MLTVVTGVRTISSSNANDVRRWRNYQHAMARVSSNGLIYCAPFNALHDLVTDDARGDNIKRHPDVTILAAAQWLLAPTECQYVHHECQKRGEAENYWEAWGKKEWGRWKTEFVYVVDSPLYDEETKNVARQALQQMNIAEEAGN